MTLSLNYKKVLAVLALLALVTAGVVLSVPKARAATLVFLTRLNASIQTYPSNDSLSVGYTGTTTQPTAKLSVYLNYLDGSANGTSTEYKSAFDIASTTATGTATTTSDIFRINRVGCVQTVATSSATPIKVQFLAVATTSANGFMTWSYGTCTP